MTERSSSEDGITEAKSLNIHEWAMILVGKQPSLGMLLSKKKTTIQAVHGLPFVGDWTAMSVVLTS